MDYMPSTGSAARSWRARTATRSPSSLLLLAAAGLGLAWPRPAGAGGFDIPDLGTEPLGRGGTFVAKADSPLALYYNIAGMARQRGTRLELDVGLLIHDTTFQAPGSYPGSGTVPYGGLPYPKVSDGQNFSPLPFLGVTTDFGFFKTLTFGLAVYAPPGIASHTFGTKVDVPTNIPNKGTISYNTSSSSGVPVPSRYDVAATNLAVLLPTLGVAWQPIKFLSIGAAAQLVYASFDLANADYTSQYLGSKTCPYFDYPGCDAYGQAKTSGFSGLGIFSLMVHPTDWLDIGATYRMFANIHTTGNLQPYSPSAFYTQVPVTPITLDARFPDWVRLGLRGVRRYPDGTERYDVEIDLTYENWASVQRETIQADDFALNNSGLTAYIPHYYKDTFGVRVGGAYNHRISDRSRFTGRLGIYYDSSATDFKYTHLDFSTAEKFGFTAGLGYKFKGFSLNLGYAFVYSPPRDVTNGALRAISTNNGSLYGSADPTSDGGCAANPGLILCHFNNGHYEWATQIISLGLTINFSEFRLPALMRN